MTTQLLETAPLETDERILEDKGDVPFLESDTWKAINFPVALEPVYTRKDPDVSVEVPNRLAVVRQDTREVLNIVSGKYKLIPHAVGFAPVAEAIDRIGLKVSKTQARTGVRGAFARFQWILDTPASVRPNDDIALAVTMVNSYNYESRFELSVGTHRWICRNGLLSPPLDGSRFGGKHMMGLKVEQAVEEISKFVESSGLMLDVYRNWAELGCTVERFEEYLVSNTPLSKKAAQTIIAYYNTQAEKTVWDAYNAVTWYATHQTRGERGVINDTRIQQVATAMARSLSHN